MYNNFNQCYLPGCSPFAPVPMGAVSPTVSLLTLPASAVFPGCSRLIAFYGFRAKPFTPIRDSVRSFVTAAIAARNNVALRRFPLALVPTPLSFSSPTISSASSALSVSLSPSCWGSVLMLSSPAFVRAVLSGVCPVSLALASFPRWCLRSALLGALCAAGRAGVFHSTDFIPVIRSFLSVALPSLGLSPSASPAVIIHGLSSYGAGGACPSRPSWVGSPSVKFDVSAVRSALSRVTSCLATLSCRGNGCPSACRPLLASLCVWVLR